MAFCLKFPTRKVELSDFLFGLSVGRESGNGSNPGVNPENGARVRKAEVSEASVGAGQVLIITRLDQGFAWSRIAVYSLACAGVPLSNLYS